MQAVPRHSSFVSSPLAQLAAALSIGILPAHFISFPLALSLIGIASFAVLTLIALIKHRHVLATLFVTLGILCAGAALANIETRSVPANSIKRLLESGSITPGEPVELTGTLESPPEFAPDRFYLNLRVQALDFKGKTQPAAGIVSLSASLTNQNLIEEYEQLELRYGARVRLMTELSRANNFRNPGVSSFAEYLDQKGYDATGFIKSPLLIERLDDERVFLPLAWLFEWRRKLETQIDSHFSAQTAGVLDAMLLGNPYKLSHDTSERFREGGTFHVLVISGLQISVIGALVYLLVSRLTRRKIWQFVVSTSLLWCYAIAVGAEPSVVRAALMFTVVSFAPIVSRRAASLNALGAAALVLLVWQPKDLFDPSFQLTFLSVLALVAFAWPLLQKFSSIGSWRPTYETPYPPSSSPWLKTFCECLYWSEQEWRREQVRVNYNCKLLKSPLAPKLERWHIQRPLRYAFAAFLLSACVQLTTLPFLIVYFHRLSIASLILNIGVSMAMALLGIVALVALVLAQVSTWAAAPLISFANGLDWMMIHSVDPFARAGIASIRLPEYSGWPAIIYALYFIPLSAILLMLARWNPLQQPQAKSQKRFVFRMLVILLGQFTMLALVVLHPLSAGRPDGKLHVDFLDVGQGDAALVTMPDGSTLLIDGGGRPDFLPRTKERDDGDPEPWQRETRSVGEAVTSEYLWWRGLDTIDYILPTHADADHIDGLNDVARNFRVRAALVARASANDLEFEKFSHTLEARGIPMKTIGAGDILRFGSVEATIVSPLATEDPRAGSRNNDSVVLRLRFGERAIVLTGDIEAAAEMDMLKRNEEVAADVVKVAHHGSKTSSTSAFIAATHPHFAIISVGQTSIFGHPHRDVVQRWQASGAEVLTTGDNGTITLTTDGKTLELKTFVKRP
jgi:competence protein ComEC